MISRTLLCGDYAEICFRQVLCITVSAHYELQIERQYRDSENYYAGPARNTMSAESYYAGLYFGRISKAGGMAHHAQMTENDSNIMRILCGSYAGCSAGGFWIFWPEPGTLAEA